MFSASQIAIKIIITILFLCPLILFLKNIVKSKKWIFKIPYFRNALKAIIYVGYSLIFMALMGKVWTSLIDIKRLANVREYVVREVDKESSWLPIRQNDAIYQNSKIVGRVSGVKDDLVKGKMYFEEIYQSNLLQRNQVFEFMEHKLIFENAESITDMDASRPNDGRIIAKVRCKIIKE